jgi:MYXO-CTERM domain-containing protein
MYFPARTSRRLTPLLAASLLFGCTGPGADPNGPDDDGAVHGEVVTYVLDFEERSETQHLLRLSDGRERPLILAGASDLAPGDRVRVWGHDVGDALAVTRFEREPGPEVSVRRSALIDGKKKPTKKWAFVLVDTGKGVNLTQQTAMDRLFSPTNPKSMKNYYHEISFGLQDLDGQVFGPLPYTPANGCDSSGVAKALRPMVQGTFDQYLWYFGSRQMCDWAGLASLGTADRPQRDSWYNASSGCVVLAQEPGHNFGMVHSSSLICVDGSGAKVPFALPGKGTCTHSEYGNIFDPMGGGNTCFHMDGFQKAYEDWLTGCNVVTVTKSGTFTLFPLETACNGVQLLQIPFGGPRMMTLANGPAAKISNYYLELRTPVGVDYALTPRVFVTVGDDLAQARGRGGRNWLLDMTSETTTKVDAALPIGRMYADPDPNGPRFVVVSADATKAVVQVQLGGSDPTSEPGAGLCDDQSMFTAPGPDTCNAAPVFTPPSDGGAPIDARPIARDTGSSGSGGEGGTGGMAGSGESGGTGGDLAMDAARPPRAMPDADSPPEEDAGDEGPHKGQNIHGSCGCALGDRPPRNGLWLLGLMLGLAVVRRRSR